MKQFLIKVLAFFVFGAVFFTGGMAALFVWSEIDPDPEEPNTILVTTPEEIQITKSSALKDTDKYTISGTLSNNSEHIWQRVNLVAVVKAGKAEVDRCTTRIYYVSKNSQKAFLIECYDIQGSNLPDNISYEIRVKEGVRFDFASTNKSDV